MAPYSTTTPGSRISRSGLTAWAQTSRRLLHKQPLPWNCARWFSRNAREIMCSLRAWRVVYMFWGGRSLGAGMKFGVIMWFVGLCMLGWRRWGLRWVIRSFARCCWNYYILRWLRQSWVRILIGILGTLSSRGADRCDEVRRCPV